MPESSRPVPLPIEIEGKGIWFDREFNGDGVEVCVEYDDHSSFRASTLERYITISREDWQRIVDALLGQPDQEVGDGLTADEAKRVRIALIFGDPAIGPRPDPDPKLEVAKAKLKSIEDAR